MTRRAAIFLMLMISLLAGISQLPAESLDMDGQPQSYSVEYPSYFDDSPLTETFGGQLAGYEIRRNYGELTGEPTRVELWKDAALVHAVDYTADGRSQIGTVTASAGKSFAATYGYPDDLTETLTAGSVVATRNFSNDGTGRLASLGTNAGGGVYSAEFGYAGGFNRRSLTLTAPGAPPVVWDYTFQNTANATGQLQAASSSTGTTYTYNHDAAGNRAGSLPNNANQYSISQVAGSRHYTVSGKVAPGATVTISRAGGAPEAVAVAPDGSFSKTYPAPPGGENPASIPLVIEGTLAGAGDNGTDAVAAEEKTITLAPSRWPSTYGAHGALASDWRWAYKWDALGRLIGMETQAQAVAAGMPDLRLKFSYDEQGRRITKTVLHKGNGGAVERTVSTRFIYDGWLLLAEETTDTAAPATIHRQYTWGKDIAGSLEETGGVGGLLAIHENGATRIPIYDANGNIIALADAATGAQVAAWSRGPFGEIIAESGDTSLCPFGFATHYTDGETGLVYFGHRFYSPETGRWLSREPLGETESFNLYGYCHNDPVNHVDVLGLFATQESVDQLRMHVLLSELARDPSRLPEVLPQGFIDTDLKYLPNAEEFGLLKPFGAADYKRALEYLQSYGNPTMRSLSWEEAEASRQARMAPGGLPNESMFALSIGAAPTQFNASINGGFLLPAGAGSAGLKFLFGSTKIKAMLPVLATGAGIEGKVVTSEIRIGAGNAVVQRSTAALSESLQLQSQIAQKANRVGGAVDRWLMNPVSANHARYGRWADTYRGIMTNPNATARQINFAKGIRGRFVDRRMSSWMESTFRSEFPTMQLDRALPGSILRPDAFFPNIGGRSAIFDFGGPSKVGDIMKYSGMADDLPFGSGASSQQNS